MFHHIMFKVEGFEFFRLHFHIVNLRNFCRLLTMNIEKLSSYYTPNLNRLPLIHLQIIQKIITQASPRNPEKEL